MTPAVHTLRDSLSILRRGGDFSRDAAKKNWRERISQLSAAKTNHDPISTLRNLCLQGFPVFNIWDSMSFIYTLCVEDIKTQLGAELHLYQFRLIISALRKCASYFHLLLDLHRGGKLERSENQTTYCGGVERFKRGQKYK